MDLAYVLFAWFIFLCPFTPFCAERNGLHSTDGRNARLKKRGDFPFPFCNGCKTNSQTLHFASKHLRTDGCCHFTVHHLDHIFICAIQPLPSISTNVFRSCFHINFAVLAPKGTDAFGFSLRLLSACLGGAVILLGCTDRWTALPALALRVRWEESR